MDTCDWCGDVVAESFDYCPRCGRDPVVDEELDHEEKKLPWNQEPPSVSFDKCSYCDELVESVYDYCPHCGKHDFHTHG